jgi:phage shock protein C
MPVNDRLYRSATDRVFSGLCGGMAEHFDLDPALVRLAWVVLDVLTGIFPLLVVYIVMVMVVPEEPPVGAPGPWPAWNGPQWGPGAPGTSSEGSSTGTFGARADATAGANATAGPDASAGPDATGADAAAGAGGSAGGTAQGGQTGGSWGGWGSPPPIGSDWRTVRAYARAQRRAQRAYWRQQRWGGDASTAGLVFGVILVIVGGVFLLQQTMPGFDSALIWPIALIVLGALLLAGAFRR